MSLYRDDSGRLFPHFCKNVETLLKPSTTLAIRIFYYLAPRRFTLSLFGFISTVITARLISYYNPNAHWQLENVHLHHFIFGIFALAVAGYGALQFTGPRAPFFIALLYGFGIGLTFDEFDMWLNLSSNPVFRWSNHGIVIVFSVALVGLAGRSIYKARQLATQRNEVTTPESSAEAAAE